jgi:ATP-dependent DNA ligase
MQLLLKIVLSCLTGRKEVYSMRILFPPRPKGRMLPTDLPHYEASGNWVAQRKFRGSRAVLHISTDRVVTLGNRHGSQFAKFVLNQGFKQEILDGLDLKDGLEYWLDGELMNKDVNATNEIILFDLLQAGKYLFGGPSQIARLAMLRQICRNPLKNCRNGLALEVTPRLWLSEIFEKDFVAHFEEALSTEQIEGLVLRKKSSCLDNFGVSEYETSNLIRCRKPFAKDKGYDF